VYTVHFLSVPSLHILGGIPIPNSKTLTHDFLAATKCHNSCKIIRIINIKTHNNIDRNIFVIKKNNKKFALKDYLITKKKQAKN
jgi:hypothetical protein